MVFSLLNLLELASKVILQRATKDNWFIFSYLALKESVILMFVYDILVFVFEIP